MGWSWAGHGQVRIGWGWSDRHCSKNCLALARCALLCVPKRGLLARTRQCGTAGAAVGGTPAGVKTHFVPKAYRKPGVFFHAVCCGCKVLGEEENRSARLQLQASDKAGFALAG